MRDIYRFMAIVASIATSTGLAGCNNESDSAKTEEAVQADPNIMLEPLGNDASTMEAIGQLPIVEPASEPAEGNVTTGAGENKGGAQPVFGDSEGGDTGGNIVKGEASGQ